MKRILLILTLFLLFSFNNLSAEDALSKIPQKLGASNYGRDFWFTVPPCYEDDSGSGQNFIKIFILSPVACNAIIEIPGKAYYQTISLEPYKQSEVNLISPQAMPFTKTIEAASPPEQIYRGAGIHVYSDQLLIVYCVVSFINTADGFMVIPVSSLEREYIISGAEVDPMFSSSKVKLPNTCGIVAAFDDTKARIFLGGNSSTLTSGGHKSGDMLEFNLMKGDVYMINVETDFGDLSGSRIISTKPIGIVTGNYCANIPLGNRWCEYTAEMELPSMSWGHYCFVPKVPNRKTSSLIKIFAKDSNTKISRDGMYIGNIETNGGVEGRGFLKMRLSADSIPKSACISGDKPISVTLFNTGIEEDGVPYPNSDPFQMLVIPMEQFMTEMTFCSPGITGGKTFAENYINLVYEIDENSYMPDDMIIAGPITNGNIQWKQINSLYPGKDEFFVSDLSSRRYAVKTLQLAGDGVYIIKSKKPFGAYSFGYSPYDSYGYPSGMYNMDLTKDDNEPPKPDYTMCCYGTISDGTITDYPDDNRVRTNLALLIMHKELSENYMFSYQEFIPGVSRTTYWILEPEDVSKPAKAVITFADRRGNDTTLILNYVPNHPVLNKKFVNYGQVAQNDSLEKDVYLVSKIKDDAIRIMSISLKKMNSGFSIVSAPPTPFLLQPLDSVKITVRYKALTQIEQWDSLGFCDDLHCFNQTKMLAGTGEPIMFCEDVDFGIVNFGDSLTKYFKVKNNGSSELIIYKTVYPYAKGVNLVPEIEESGPLTLAPYEEKTFALTYTPLHRVFGVHDRVDFIANTTRDKLYCNFDGYTLETAIRADNVDFGGVQSGGTAVKNLVLHNEGNQLGRVSKMTIHSPKFSLINSSYPSTESQWNIFPGDSLIKVIKFDDTQPGQHIDTVIFDTDNLQSPTSTSIFKADIVESSEDNLADNRDIIVYPNPANNELFLECNLSGSFKIRIHDISGKLRLEKDFGPIMTFMNGKVVLKIDVSSLESASYIIDIVTSYGNLSKQFTISR